MSFGVAYEAIKYINLDAAFGALLGTTTAIGISLKLLSYQNYSIFTKLLLGTGFALTGCYVGMIASIGFFKPCSSSLNCEDNLENIFIFRTS
jgi:hypothetical protein